jgi:hypothetical protein
VRVIFRERIQSRDSRLGRHVHHDSESRHYEYRPARSAPVSVRHQRRIPILDQGSLGSCTGNAGIGCLGTDPFYATLKSPKFGEDEAGAVKLYSAATAADDYPGQYPPDDTGSDGLTIAKVLKAAGSIAGYQHTFSLDAALLALADYPLITGVNWYDGMFDPSAEGIVSVTGALAGGHEFVVSEFDAGRGLVGCDNSWGTGWGVQGRFYLQVEDFGMLLSQQGDVTVFVPVDQPAPVPTPPSPAPGDADSAFAAVLHPWVRERHVSGNAHVAAAGKTWLAAKGL